jgi:hypothetical protein
MKIAAQKFALLIFSFLVMLFLGELFVRLFVPQELIIRRPDIWRPDDTFGHRHQENVNTVINRGLGPVHVVTDSNGYRVNHRRTELNHDSDISILVIGDSFIEGLAVENESTIPGLIHSQLRDKHGEKVQVDNAAVAGWNPNHYLLEAKRALGKRSYTLGIVFLYVGNDVITKKESSFQPESETPKARTQDYKFQVPSSLELKEIINSIFLPIGAFLETKSHLFVLSKQVIRIPLARLRLTSGRGFPIFEVNKANSSRWRITAEVCEETQNEFSRYNTPVFFVLLPSIIQLYDDILKQYIWGLGLNRHSIDPYQPNRLLKGEFEARKLLLVDPLEYMSSKAKEGHEMYGTVDRHFNENGHKSVSEYIAPVVELYTVMAH